jgi:uncharacterized membrane protein YvlD (DUF360 family)
MNITRARLVQVISVFVVHAITLWVLQALMGGFQVSSLRALLVITLVLGVAQSAFWWIFVNFFAWLPVWLYPILTFFLNGLFVVLVGNLIQGVTIATVGTGIWITIWLTVVDAILSGLLSLDEDAQFDRNVTRRMVSRHGKPAHSDVPGFLFLEIDGLSEMMLCRAIEEGHMPNLKRWIDQGSHQILGWETDYSSQTGAMQTGILLGDNTDVPAYRWWDREENRMVMSGVPKDAQAIEARLSSGKGLCSDGGSSRGNMFSADATESMFTFSTLRNRARGRGPGFYFYLLSPYVIARLITRFVIEVVKEWWEAAQQRRRKDKYMVKARNLPYAFLRAFMGPVLQDLVTYTVISDILRGVPAVYALYAGYDDLAHFAGMNSPEAFEALHETDRYFARIEHTLTIAPRPYHVIVLSDHGQTLGPTFETAHGQSLEKLVQAFTKSENEVFYSNSHSENWDSLNSVLSESTNSNTRTAGLIRKMLASRTHDDVVEVAPKNETADKVETKAEKAKVVVFGSGSTGLIYFTESRQRMTFEQIQETYPEILLGLQSHPGIGFVLVRSEEQGDIVVGKGGVHYLVDDHVEGADPIAVFGPNAPRHLRRESSFSNCPDLVVNTTYDPETQEMAGFENQVSHHGGLGGPQNHPFILHPTVLPYDGRPIIGAMAVHGLLRGWREQVQGLNGANGAREPGDAEWEAQPVEN